MAGLLPGMPVFGICPLSEGPGRSVGAVTVSTRWQAGPSAWAAGLYGLMVFYDLELPQHYAVASRSDPKGAQPI